MRELAKKSEADILKVRNFGKTSLREVKRKLANMGLSLGMDVDGMVVTPVHVEEEEEEVATSEEKN